VKDELERIYGKEYGYIFHILVRTGGFNQGKG
jgi:hypothetical protein